MNGRSIAMVIAWQPKVTAAEKGITTSNTISKIFARINTNCSVKKKQETSAQITEIKTFLWENTNEGISRSGTGHTSFTIGILTEIL